MTVAFNLTELLNNIEENHKISMVRLEEVKERRKRRTQDTALFLQEATGSGLSLKIPMDFDYPTFRMDIDAADDWRVLHSIVGDLEKYTVEPYGDDLRKRLVDVTLTPKDERFKHIKFVYTRKLEKNDKCKMVRQKSSYVSVVCQS